MLSPNLLSQLLDGFKGNESSNNFLRQPGTSSLRMLKINHHLFLFVSGFEGFYFYFLSAQTISTVITAF